MRPPDGYMVRLVTGEWKTIEKHDLDAAREWNATIRPFWLEDKADEREDMALLIRKLCRSIQGDKAIKRQALDYLKAKGLSGEVLRQESAEDVLAAIRNG